MRIVRGILLLGLLALGAACTNINPTPTPTVATATLQPLATFTPRFTATPLATATPRPSLTYTPSETPIPPTPSDTPTPTATPPITGRIASAADNVNMRDGPGTDSRIIQGVANNTDLIVLAASEDQEWFNVRLDDGTEGWIAADLIRVQASPTPTPSDTPEGMVLLVSGTPVATSLFGGQPITATPSPEGGLASGDSPQRTPGTVTATPTVTPTTTPGGNVPTVTRSFSGTLPASPTGEATATITPSPTGLTVATQTLAPPSTLGASTTPGTGDGTRIASPTPGAPAPAGGPRQGVDVLAYCRQFNESPPPLPAGSTIDIYWGWIVRDPSFMQQHLDAVVYEVRFDGRLLTNWRQYGTDTLQQADGTYAMFWYVPVLDPLPAGTYEITYRVSWSEAISDGFQQFGPGTGTPTETGDCTVEVR